jgi:membrane-associated phospholipid phosphatase
MPRPVSRGLRARRLDPDARLGLELTLWGVAAFAVLVPFGVLFALVRSHSSGLQDADQNVASHAHALAVANPGLVTFMRAASTAGAPRTFWVLVAIAAIALLVKRAGRLAVWAGVTMAGAALLDNVIKTVTNRARPHFANPVATAPGSSFPSGHALESLAGCAILLAIVLPLMRPLWRRLTVVIAIAVVATASTTSATWQLAGFLRPAGSPRPPPHSASGAKAPIPARNRKSSIPRAANGW